jgi:hypothetical protein
MLEVAPLTQFRGFHLLRARACSDPRLPCQKIGGQGAAFHASVAVKGDNMANKDPLEETMRISTKTEALFEKAAALFIDAVNMKSQPKGSEAFKLFQQVLDLDSEHLQARLGNFQTR